MHLTRFHGVFAPHSKLRAAVTPAHRGVGSKTDPANSDQPITPRHVAMTWAQRLKRVFGVEINACARCGGKLKVIASIEEPQVIQAGWWCRADREPGVWNWWTAPEGPEGGNSGGPPRQTAPGQGV